MRVGLLFVRARAVARRPNAAPVKSLRTALEQNGRKLQFYQRLQYPLRESPCLLALSIVDRGTEAEDRAFSSLPPLPPVYTPWKEEIIEEENTYLASEEKELPPELEPLKMDDGFPQLPDDCDLEDIDDYDDTDWDALDVKNTPDFDPDQDDEAEFFIEDAVNGWLRSDNQQCRRGSKPTLFEYVNISNKSAAGIYSKHYDPSPLTSIGPRYIHIKEVFDVLTVATESSILSSSLLVTQIPALSNHESNKTDTDLITLFKSYAYLTSAYDYVRVSLFRQNDPELPRWLLVQEFKSLGDQPGTCGLKKKQLEYWWRMKGWEGVLVELLEEAPEDFGWTGEGEAK